MHYTIEPAREHDHALVYDSWIKAYRDSPRTHSWEPEVYWTYQHAVCERLIKRSSLLVARPPDWDEGVLGWLCAEQTPDEFCVHFAVTKPPFRQQGIFWSLVDSLKPRGRLVYSHLRPPFSRTLNNRGYVWDKTKAR